MITLYKNEINFIVLIEQYKYQILMVMQLLIKRLFFKHTAQTFRERDEF